MRYLTVGTVALAIAAGACVQQEAVNCPDKYEGQVVTLAGKITKTASFLGIATLSTIQDGKGGVCLVITRSGIGNEGDSVRLTNMVAIHDESTIVPNFLRRADEAAVTATPVPTVRATATPQPAIRRKVTESVTYTNGWRVTTLGFSEQQPTRFSTPRPGLRLVAVSVRFDNGSSAAVHANPFEFKVQDSNGVRRDPTFCYQCRDDDLNAAEVAPGGFLTGSIFFEAPIGDARLELVYQSFGYALATWELY